MKYLIIAILFILSLGYAGYYLYMFDKRENITQKFESLNKEVPEYLTEKFWQNVTPKQLKEKLINITDINKIRVDTLENMFVLLIRHGQYPEIVDILVSAGADYSPKTKKSYEKTKATVLHWSVLRAEKSYDFTRALLKHYKSIDEPDEFSKSSPLQWALYFRTPIEVIRLLLSLGADPNFQDKNKYTPLMSASIPNQYSGISFIDPKVIQLLLDYKANITIRNNEGKTAYDYMTENEEFAKTELFQKISIQF